MSAATATAPSRPAPQPPAPPPPTFTDREVMAALAAEIDPADVLTRKGDNSKTYRFINEETCRRILDTVVGPENWSDEIVAVVGKAPDSCSVCRITITLPSGKTLVRSSVGSLPLRNEKAFIGQQYKNSDTDAFKRACKRLGIGANLPPENPDYDGPGRGGYPARRDDRPAPRPNGGAPRPPQQGSGNGGADRPPHDGASLCAWLNHQQEASADAEGVFSHVVAFGKSKGWPGMVKSWNAAQVAEAHAAAKAYIEGEAY